MIEPLQKHDKNGVPYTRFADNQAILVVLDTLTDDDIVKRCTLGSGNEQHVPTECLVHMLRRGLRNNYLAITNPLYVEFMRRLRRAIPQWEGPESQFRIRAYEQVQDRLNLLFAKESTQYQERLDFLEIRFDGAMARMLQDARRNALKARRRFAPLFNEETGELDPKVERAIGSFNPFDPEKFSDEHYRSVLDEAMEELPITQKRIIEMMRNEVLIDSQDPNVPTISKALGLSEKTIRNQRDKAILAMKAFVNKGEN